MNSTEKALANESHLLYEQAQAEKAARYSIRQSIITDKEVR